MKNNTLVPNHVGFIMDGNGRWAKQKSLDRTQGHLNGIQSTKDSMLACMEFGVSFVTLFVFSTENWKRPRPEVNFILEMVAGNLRKHYDFYRDNNIKVVHSGNIENLSPTVLHELNSVMEETTHNNTITLNLAFNYGGRDEIVRAVSRYIKDNNRPHQFSETVLDSYLDRPEIPPMDLMIRTGGQKRISNFLLWQCAYTELYFSDTLWPDWNKEATHTALLYYQNQDRRFGAL